MGACEPDAKVTHREVSGMGPILVFWSTWRVHVQWSWLEDDTHERNSVILPHRFKAALRC